MITVFHKSITFASPRNLRTCRQNRLGILRPQFSFFGAVPDAVVLGRLVTELLSTRRYYLVAVLYCESRAKVSKGQLFETRTKNEGENKDKEFSRGREKSSVAMQERIKTGGGGHGTEKDTLS